MNMDPLTPATSTLSPAVSHIAETATSLAATFRERCSKPSDETLDGKLDSKNARRLEEQATVRWVLATPARLRAKLEAGKEEEASKEWAEVQQLLGNWDGVAGVKELRNECAKLMREGKSNLN